MTELDLSSKSLTGTIPAELGRLFEITTLDLSSNSLTGEIPEELGWLENLVEIRLSGNTLTGCIPVALEDVATNDLSSLNLLYCSPPAPENLSAGSSGENSIDMTWDSVSNASKYRMEYRKGTFEDWTTDDDTLTSTSHTVDELLCEREYQFRVSAYGSGTTYAVAWSAAWKALSASTSACVTPQFDAASYTLSVVEDAADGAVVGTVTATDPNDYTVSYAITAGNDDGQFAIDRNTGQITVVGGMTKNAPATLTLTVTVTGSNGNAASTDVTITVTVDYDTDDDGLIEVSSLAQLHAIRWDLDGDGESTKSRLRRGVRGCRYGHGLSLYGVRRIRADSGPGLRY